MSARNLLIVILVAALGLRGLAAVIVTKQLEAKQEEFLIAGDARGYWELGNHLAAGEAYEVRGRPGDLLARDSLVRKVNRMPGFPAMLAVSIRLFGPSLLAARLLLAVIGTLACWLVYLLGSRLFSTRTGLLAAACCAGSPMLAGFSVLVLSETLFATLLLASLLAATGLGTSDRIDEHPPRLGAAAWTGLAASAAVYVRPGWLPAIPAFAVLWVATSPRRRRAMAEAAALVGVVLLGLLPWVWRNHRVTGHPVLTTLWVGPSLYDGLNPNATGASDMQFITDDGLYADPKQTEYSIDAHYRRAAWKFATTHPVTTLRLAVVKAWRFLKPWPSAKQFRRPWQLALVASVSLALYLLAARGWWFHRQATWSWLLAAAPLLYFVAIHTVFVGSLRYRVPTEYSLWILAAAGLRREEATG